MISEHVSRWNLGVESLFHGQIKSICWTEGVQHVFLAQSRLWKGQDGFNRWGI